MTNPYEYQMKQCPLCRSPAAMGENAKPLYTGWACTSCVNAFAWRRRFAYFIDHTIVFILVIVVFAILDRRNLNLGRTLLAHVNLDVDNVLGIVSALILSLKDGFVGKSPGRLWLGITVVEESSRRPIGIWASFKRNLCLIVPLGDWIIFLTLKKGRRLGDGWARTRVIWDKYRHTYPFEDWGYVCRSCGYDLRGNRSGVCPECGTAAPEAAGVAWNSALPVADDR